MGASLFPAASSTLNTSAAPITTTSLTAEAIKSGDLVSLGLDGALYWAADPNGASAAYRPFYLPTDTYFSQGTGVTTASASNVGYSENPGFMPVILADGGYLVTWLTSSAVMFTIYNKDGSVRVANVSLGARVSGGTEYAPIVAKRLNNGNVVVVAQGASGYLNAYIVAPDGTIAVPAAALDNTLAWFVDCVVLTGGNVAITWSSGANTSSVVTKYAVISQAGAVVLSGTSLSGTNTQATPRSSAIAAQADGTFAITWFSLAGTTGSYVQKFSAAGAASGSATILNSATNAYQKLQMVALTGGGYAIVHAVDALNGAAVNLMVISAAMVRLNVTALTGCNTSTVYTATDLVATADGGVVVVWGATVSSTAYVYGAKYSATATVVVAQGAISLAKLPTSANQAIRIYAAIDGSNTFFVTLANGGTGYIGQLDASLAFLRGASIAMVSSGAPMLMQWYDSLNTAALDLTFINANSPAGVTLNMQQYIYFLRGRLPVGVAAADAAAGVPLTYTVVGVATTRLTFTKPLVVDYTANAGQKMALIGNTAILKGIQL